MYIKNIHKYFCKYSAMEFLQTGLKIKGLQFEKSREKDTCVRQCEEGNGPVSRWNCMCGDGSSGKVPMSIARPKIYG